jgi:4-amino-4-deoxy-L-arabinose transferase-like glycosyltransferase
LKTRLGAWLLAAAGALLLLHTAWQKSPTWDETGYFGLGARLLQTGRWDVPAACSHPPLAFYLHSLPVFLYPVDWSAWQYRPGLAEDLGFLRAADPRRGNALLLDPAYDGQWLFFLCRATSLVLYGLLAWVLYRWGSQLHGRPGGLLALLLLAFCPNTLAHASLINTDFAFAATFALAAYTFQRLLRDPTPRRLAGAALGLGLALASKLSALVLLPGLGLGLAWYLAFASEEEGQRLAQLQWWPGRGPWGQGAVMYLGVVLGAVLVLWALYGFQVHPYLLTLRSQMGDLESGHEAYLLGQYSTKGWWYYYPLALLVKTPVPLLILGAWGWVRALHQRARWGEMGLVCWPPLLLLGLFVVGGKDIGLRYLLPVYPFLFLVAGYALRPWQGWAALRASGTRAWPAWALGLCCLWHVGGTLRNHPDHLAYFNELAGGPDQGYRYLVDSNLDWGQDLKGLKAYLDERHIERIKLSYFGTVDPALYGLRYEWLPSFQLPAPPDAQAVLPTGGLIAISVTNLVGVYMDGYGQGKDLYQWLRAYEPVARIGHSIWVYDLPENPAPAFP